MTTSDNTTTGGLDMSRPAMVNGFWEEGDRPKAEAAAEELRTVGAGTVEFSAAEQSYTAEYNSEGGFLGWVKEKLGMDTEENEEDVPPVVLRTWPPDELTNQVAEVMKRHGAYKVNRWESQGYQRKETTSLDDLHSTLDS